MSNPNGLRPIKPKVIKERAAPQHLEAFKEMVSSSPSITSSTLPSSATSSASPSSALSSSPSSLSSSLTSAAIYEGASSMSESLPAAARANDDFKPLLQAIEMAGNPNDGHCNTKEATRNVWS